MKLLRELLKLSESRAMFDDDAREELERTLEDGIGDEVADAVDDALQKILGVHSDDFQDDKHQGGGYQTSHSYYVNVMYRAGDLKALEQKIEQRKEQIIKAIKIDNEFVENFTVNSVDAQYYAEADHFYDGWGRKPILVVSANIDVDFEDPDSFEKDNDE